MRCCRQDLGARLGELAVKLRALRDAFESVQDLVDLPGLRVWHTQLQRVISANLAAELRRCRLFLHRRLSLVLIPPGLDTCPIINQPSTAFAGCNDVSESPT